MAKLTISMFKEALKGTGGIYTIIGEKLGKDRTTIGKFVDKHPEVLDELNNEKARIKDKAKANVYKRIIQDDPEMSKWYLSRTDDEFRDKQQVDTNLNVKTDIEKIRKMLNEVNNEPHSNKDHS